MYLHKPVQPTYVMAAMSRREADFSGCAETPMIVLTGAESESTADAGSLRVGVPGTDLAGHCVIRAVAVPSTSPSVVAPHASADAALAASGIAAAATPDCAALAASTAAASSSKQPSCHAAAPSLLMLDSSSVPMLPAFGSPEEWAYFQSWANGAVFNHAVQHIPPADIDFMERAMAKIGRTGSRLETAVNLAYCRLSNRICDACMWKPARGSRRHESRLRLCSGCCLAWFCSEECRSKAHARTYEKNRSKHLLRCCVALASAPLDDGPMSITVVSLKE